ncbi:MAG: PQQ-binding-like beta-propeller repeat protein [Acidobacteria bacterium]|nr:PQQ-binding-like beta-propeller repeat protein [Acidobacteriota bacterium]
MKAFWSRAAIAALACAVIAPLGAQTQPSSHAPQLVDWLTDGGDNQRTGWNRDEQILTKANVGSLKLLWKLQTDNEPRALHSLMPVLVVGQLPTTNGPKQVGFVAGISDNLYAFDVETGKVLWQKHWTYEQPAGRGGGGGGQPQPRDPRHLGFLRPGGSSDTPVIGPPDAQGRRPIYFVTGDGTLHTLNAADGTDLQPPFMFHAGKGWALNLVGNTVWMADTYAGISIAAVKLDDPSHTVMTYNAGSGGAWGRRGAVIDSHGNAYSTTGDGVYDPASDPPRYANSVIGVTIDGDKLRLKDYYTPRNWDWLRKRDLDPNNTPTIFTYKGRELMAASGKECRIYLLDPASLGGADHQTPLFKTDLFCNEDVDFQDAGSWGALSTWEDERGTRWVLAPFWGPVHSRFKAPIMNTPTPQEGGVAAFTLADRDGALELTPAWVSRDMHRGEPVIVVNGMVFGYGSGEYTGQAFPDVGLQFDSTIRASKGTRAVIYALDAQTGKELWSSGEQMHQWNHFSGITVVNGRVYLGTYDGTLYCFGVTP